MSSIMGYSLDPVYSEAEWEKIKIKMPVDNVTVHVGTEKPEDREFWKLSSLKWCACGRCNLENLKSTAECICCHDFQTVKSIIKESA